MIMRTRLHKNCQKTSFFHNFEISKPRAFMRSVTVFCHECIL
eukprot:UN05515